MTAEVALLLPSAFILLPSAFILLPSEGNRHGGDARESARLAREKCRGREGSHRARNAIGRGPCALHAEEGRARAVRSLRMLGRRIPIRRARDAAIAASPAARRRFEFAAAPHSAHGREGRIRLRRRLGPALGKILTILCAPGSVTIARTHP